MKEYIVIALSVGALNNKIFHSGDKVSELAFAPGRAEELVKQGFLRPVDPEPAEDKVQQMLKKQLHEMPEVTDEPEQAYEEVPETTAKKKKKK